MKKIAMFILMLGLSFTFAQNATEPKIEKLKNGTKVTYFYENGIISQQGHFNTKGKLHGEWISYDLEGNKTVLAYYENGNKVGKWFFWIDDKLKEVNYQDSKVKSVFQWDNKKVIASN